ncbi:hypothetical protein [Gordonia sputi]
MQKIAKIIGAGALAVGLAFAGAGAADAAQGGIDPVPLHGWFKVSRAELQTRSAQSACVSTGLSTYNCYVLADAVNRERSRNPRANGYWSTFYPWGAVYSGTW